MVELCIAFWAALAFAAQVAAVGQVAPCGSGQQFNSGASITSGSPTYYSPAYVSAANLGVNVTGGSIGGSANLTLQAGSAICLGPGFGAAATNSGGGFTALIGGSAPAGAFSVTGATLAPAVLGVGYSQALTATGGAAPYTWTLQGGTLSSSGLSLSSSGIITGTPSLAGTFSLTVHATDVNGATTAALGFTVTVSASGVLPLSINGGSGTGQTLATVTVPLAFGISDPDYGANDILWAEFYLADSSGGAHCYGDWGRPNGLDLFDGNAGGPTYGFGIVQNDSFCSVSLVSITNSVDGLSATVVLNFVFNPGFTGTYTVQQLVTYSVEGTGSWQSVGNLTIEAPPSVSPQPTVTLTDNTQNSGTYLSGDSFTLTVTGPPNQPVSVNINGVAYGTQGTTNASGVYSISGTWTNGNAGGFVEDWYVESLASPSLQFSVLAPNDPPGPASIPNSYTGAAPQLPCADITGNWIATPSAGPVSEWDLTQTGTTVSGTSYLSDAPGCTVAAFTVAGFFSGGLFEITESAPAPATDPVCDIAFVPSETHTITLSGNSCSAGTGTWTNDTGTGSVTWNAKTTKNTVTPTSTPTTAHYLIEYSGYIPVDNIYGPRFCSPLVPLNWLIYKGDAYRRTARVDQSWIVIPGARHAYNFTATTGPTRNYAPPSPLGPKDANGNNTLSSNLIPGDDPYAALGSYTGLDEDTQGGDCYKFNAAGHADTSEMQQSLNPTFSPPTTTVPFTGKGYNPLELAIAPIYWYMNVVINETSPSAPSAYVVPSHTCYPAHTVKVNGTTVYDWQPGPGDNNPWYLWQCMNQSLPLITAQQAAFQVATQ